MKTEIIHCFHEFLFLLRSKEYLYDRCSTDVYGAAQQ